jgi:hypothetical protein
MVSTYTGQHNTERTNIHASSVIRTHDLKIKAIKIYSSDRAATGTDEGKITDTKYFRSVF